MGRKRAAGLAGWMGSWDPCDPRSPEAFKMDQLPDDALARYGTGRLVAAVGEVLTQLGTGAILNPPRTETLSPTGLFRLEMPATLLDAAGRPWLTGAKILEEPAGGHGRTARTELHDLRTGRRACLEANPLTDLRTGAAAVWALRWLHGEVGTLGLLGTGRVARWVARAAQQLLGITRLQVYSRSADKRERFAADVPDVPVVLCESAEDACAGAAAVVAVAPVTQPLLTAARIPVGVTAVAIEGDPRVVLVDPALLLHRPLVVDREPQARASGSWLTLGADLAAVEIAQVACGAVRVAPGAVVLFTGLAALDVALAARVWLGD